MAKHPDLRTPKGTALPLLDLKGKPYLQVAHRLVWFREEHPDWSIATIAEDIGADHARFRAIISDTNGQVIATATKYEDKRGFPDFIEKAETGAVGRALAMCGYGTQFAPELIEGDRLVDTPVAPAVKAPPAKAPPAAPVKSILDLILSSETLEELRQCHSSISTEEEKKAYLSKRATFVGASS